MGTRCLLMVLAYFMAFSVVGQWFNSCWGLLYAPLLTLGLAWVPPALGDLWRAVWQPSVERNLFRSHTQQ
jgi:hypothetical protein